MWIFLPVLQLFLNLSHFVRARIMDNGSIVLFRADNSRDQTIVDDPKDVAALKSLFEHHGLNQFATLTSIEFETAGTGEGTQLPTVTIVPGEQVTPLDNPPPPAEASTDFTVNVSSLSSDPPAFEDNLEKPTDLGKDQPAAKQDLVATEEAAPDDTPEVVEAAAKQDPIVKDEPDQVKDTAKADPPPAKPKPGFIR